MKILHIVNHVRDAGNGFVNAAVDLACMQAKSGHEVGLIASRGEYEALLNQYGVQHFLRQEQGGKFLRHLHALRRYATILQAFQPDVIHAHQPREVILAFLLKLSFDYALVSTVHTEFQRRAIFTGLASRVIAVSEAVAQSMIRRGVSPNKVRIVVNGTTNSPRRRSIAHCLPQPLHQPAIVTVAGMQQRKGIAELIHAFDHIAGEFPQAHLYLVGDGPDRPLFEALAQRTRSGSRIHFEGFQAEPQSYLLSAHIFVLASHKDPSPLVISEAREAGCAIVATEVDGIPEALDHGQAGVLVPSKNSFVLAAALRRLLNDPNLLKAYRQRSQHNLQWFSVDRVVEQTLKVYAEVYVDS